MRFFFLLQISRWISYLSFVTKLCSCKNHLVRKASWFGLSPRPQVEMIRLPVKKKKKKDGFDATNMIGKCLKCTLQKKKNLVLSPHTHLEIYAASLRKHLILMPQKMDAKWLEMSPGVASLPRSQSCYVSVHGCCKNMAGSMGKRPDPSVDVKGSFSPQWGTEITTILNFRWLYTRENVFRLDTPPWTFKNMRIWIGVPSQVECLYTGYMR